AVHRRPGRCAGEDETQSADEAQAIGRDEQAQSRLKTSEQKEARQRSARDDADVARRPQPTEPLLEPGPAGNARHQWREGGPEDAHVGAEEEHTQGVPPLVRPQKKRQTAQDPQQVGDRDDPYRTDPIDSRPYDWAKSDAGGDG